MTSAPGQPVALVTGGGRGIGREIVLALAREGCNIAVAARSSDQVTATAETARGLGVQAMALALDVTDAEMITRVVAAVGTRLGPVDVLVNNAGIAESASRRPTRRSGTVTCASTRPAPTCSRAPSCRRCSSAAGGA